MMLERAFLSALSLLMLAGGLPCAGGFGCPRECDCLTNNDAEQTLTLDCSGRDLLELPYPLPNRTSHLYMLSCMHNAG